VKALSDYPLCIADDATFWPWRTWREIGSWPERHGAVVVIPVAGMADWGLGESLDAEERVLLSALAEAAKALAPAPWLLVLPPLRFVLGPAAVCAFSVEPPVAHALLEEAAVSVAAAGFRRMLFFNSSPWNEELCSAAARDLHVERNLDVFCLHLAALGLDFHPERGGERAALHRALAALRDGSPPDTAARQLAGLLAELRDWKAPGPVPS
jgi:creatinine amidohydrolase